MNTLLIIAVLSIHVMISVLCFVAFFANYLNVHKKPPSKIKLLLLVLIALIPILSIFLIPAGKTI